MSRIQQRRTGAQEVRPGHATGLVVLAVVMSLIAAAVGVGAIALSLARESDLRACRTIAWGAVPAATSLPSGWSMASNRIFVDNLTTTLVGPAPTDTTQQPAVYVSIGCYGSDVELAYRRSHEAERAAGSSDIPFATLGEQSFAVTGSGGGSTTVFFRRGILIADLTAPSSLDASVLHELGRTVDGAIIRAIAAGPDGPAVAQPSPERPPTSSANPASASPSASSSPLAESHVAPELEARLPDSFSGIRLTSQSVSGAVALGDDATAQAVRAGLASLGKGAGDLFVAQSIDPTGSLRLRLDAYEVHGVASPDLRRVLVESLLVDPTIGAISSSITIAGEQVTKVEYQQAPPTYFVERPDAVFVIQTADQDIVATVMGLLE